jgi:hypothetical protein
LPIVGVWIADGGQCRALAAQAVRERHTHLAYLEALLAAEVDERERHAIARRLKDAHLPRVTDAVGPECGPDLHAALVRDRAADP